MLQKTSIIFNAMLYPDNEFIEVQDITHDTYISNGIMICALNGIALSNINIGHVCNFIFRSY